MKAKRRESVRRVLKMMCGVKMVVDRACEMGPIQMLNKREAL